MVGPLRTVSDIENANVSYYFVFWIILCRWARTRLVDDSRASGSCGLREPLCCSADGVPNSSVSSTRNRYFWTCSGTMHVCRLGLVKAFYFHRLSICMIFSLYLDARLVGRDAISFFVVVVGHLAFGQAKLDCQLLFGLVSL